MTLVAKTITCNSPLFVEVKRPKNGKWPANGASKEYVNINNISNLKKLEDNKWEAFEYLNGGSRNTYYFDDEGAKKILDYIV